MTNDLIILNIDQLQPNPFQPRDKIKKESLSELIESIKTHGVIEPLIVANTPAGYQIIAGERRWRAAKEAGLKEISVLVKKTSPKQMLEIALVENVQRSNLNAIERATGFQQLIRDFGFSIEELTQQISKSQSYISNSLRLLRLPDAIKDGVIEGVISEGHARALAGLDNESQQIKCYRKIVNENASVRRTEQIVRQLKQKINSQNESKTIDEKNKEIEVLVKTLKRELESPPEINLTRTRNLTRLVITLKGDRKKTDKDLQRVLKKLKK